MPLPVEMTLSELVRSHPETLPVLNRHSLDLCCGGGKSLAEVSQRHGIPLATLLAELDQAIAAGKTGGQPATAPRGTR